MNRFILLACAAIAVLALPARASAQPAHANSKKAEVHVSEAIVMGTTTLKPGDYTVQCMDIDGKDYLVVSDADNGKEVARVPCTPENLTRKVEMTEYRSMVAPDGARKVTSVRIRGEMIAHKLVLP